MPLYDPYDVHHHGHGLLLLAIIIVSSLLLLPTVFVTSKDSHWTYCRSSSSSAPSSSPGPSPSPSSSPVNNSTFWSNVVALLDMLPSAAAPTGFASISHGNGTDRAFVRATCRGDSTPADCARYLQGAALVIQSRRCSGSGGRRAVVFYDDGSTVTYPAPMMSFISYADTNTTTGDEDEFRMEAHNSQVVPDKDTFDRAYSTLMARLTQRVVDNNNNNNNNVSWTMFATGAAVYDSTAPNGTMYGLLQCMRDTTAAECEQCLQYSVQVLRSCCYANQGGIIWGYNCYLRVEIYPYYNLALDGPPLLLLAPAPSPIFVIGENQGKKKVGATLAVALPAGVLLAAVFSIIAVLLYRRNQVANARKTPPADNSSGKEEDTGYVESVQLDQLVLRSATNNFSEENKIGEGGFGEVFKGTLPDGEQIAVKRLSRNSSQGFDELKNELVLAAKLQHRNLVRLMGVSLQEEKLIIYEYMPNRSLDTFLHDSLKRQQLDWSKRFSIINGIARGLLYLHEESRLKVIHRDLKPSNVLLDADMNPKISDFGIARAFHGDQSRDITRRPVGTLGYMSPEYAYWGHVSSKSDMFSFGVIVLELVTGRRNNSAYDSAIDSVSVLSQVWDKWRTGSTADVVDPFLTESWYPESEVLNCIEVGLLCVQENPADRPDASTVVFMLTSPTSTSDDRRAPSRPAFIFSSAFDQQPSMATVSENEVSISELQPR